MAYHARPPSLVMVVATKPSARSFDSLGDDPQAASTNAHSAASTPFAIRFIPSSLVVLRARRSLGVLAVALLELLAAAAGAGVVAADLGCVAPHGVDLVALVAREVGQVGDRGDEVVDAVLQVLQRLFAVEGGDDFAL